MKEIHLSQAKRGKRTWFLGNLYDIPKLSLLDKGVGQTRYRNTLWMF